MNVEVRIGTCARLVVSNTAIEARATSDKTKTGATDRNLSALTERLTKRRLGATRDATAERGKSLEVVWKGCFCGTGCQGRAGGAKTMSKEITLDGRR